MAEFALLRLDPALADLEWLHCDTVQGALSAPVRCDQTPVPSALLVIALVASPAITIRYLQIPKEGKARFRQAVAFKLEDSLAEDVEQLRFFLPEQIEDGIEPVAVLNQDFAAKIDVLKVRYPALKALVPLACLLPVDTVWVEHGMCSYRFGSDDAGSIENDAFGGLLRIKQGIDGALPLQVYLTGGVSSDAARWPKHFIVEALPQSMPFLANRLLLSPKLLSLLPHAPLRTGRKLWNGARGAWKWPIGITAALIAVQLLAFSGRWWLLANEASAQQAKIESLFTQLFANQPMSADPLAMIQSKLRSEQLQAQVKATGGALALFRRIAPILYTEVKPTLLSANYRDAELELAFRAPDLATIDSVRSRLATLPGLSVSLGTNNIDPDGKMLTGRIKISEQSL